MAERATIARPYAKAAFEAALRRARLRAVVCRAHGRRRDRGRSARDASSSRIRSCHAADVADFIIGVAGDKLDAHMQNFVRVLAENHRLLLLPEILAHYEVMRAEVENTVDVEVISAVKLDPAQAEKLAGALNTRLKRRVNMRNTVDASLLGGAVIHAGDLVIDGSLKGRLQRLRTELTS